MATSGIQVYSLDVGQGMCTFVEIYNQADEITNVLLFDLGSSKNSTEAGGPTVKFLVQQINKRKPGPFIDAIFLSHKDGDHVSLIAALLKKLPGVAVGRVCYGGRYEWYSSVLNELAKRCEDLRCFSIGQTNFMKEFQGYVGAIWRGNDVNVYLLAVNTPFKSEKPFTSYENISNKPNGDQANSKSMVCVVRYLSSDFVISGDATYPTFGYINTLLGNLNFSWVKMLLLPHHGSRKTTFGLPKTDAKISDEARLVVQTFAFKMGSKTLIASADTKHSHPSLETTALFQQYTDTNTWWQDDNLEGHRHYLSAFIDFDLKATGATTVKKGDYKSFQTTWNVYSTLYFNGGKIGKFSYPPLANIPEPNPDDIEIDVEFPWGMNWIYTLPAGGGVNLVGVSSNREVLDDAIHPDMLAAADFGAKRMKTPTQPLPITEKPVAAPALGPCLPPRRAQVRPPATAEAMPALARLKMLS